MRSTSTLYGKRSAHNYYSRIYHYDNGTRSSRIVSHTHTHTHTHTHVQNTGLTLSRRLRSHEVDRQYVHAQKDRGGAVSALTWSTDDMRMRKGTGAGLTHAHLAGVGLVA